MPNATTRGSGSGDLPPGQKYKNNAFADNICKVRVYGCLESAALLVHDVTLASMRVGRL